MMAFSSNPPKWLQPVIAELPRRLSGADIAELHFLWREYEAAIGFKALDPESVHSTNPSSASDPFEDDDVLRAIGRGNRIRRILTRLPSLYQVVLYRTYGDLRPWAPYGQFGDLAQIVEYVPSVQRAAEKAGLPTRQYIDKRLREKGSKEFIASTKSAAERLLCEASNAYREAKKCSQHR